MATKYPTPAGDSVQPIVTALKQIKTAQKALQRPDGSRIAQLYQQVQIALANVATSVATAFAALVAGGFSTPGSITVGGNLIANSGTLYSNYAYSHPVVTTYLAAYINSDGRFGATPSARKFKRDIVPKQYKLEQLLAIEVVNYRLRAAFIMQGDEAATEVGVIAEQLIDAGLSEFVAFDVKGKPFSVHYERLALVAISGIKELAAKVETLTARLDAAGL